MWKCIGGICKGGGPASCGRRASEEPNPQRSPAALLAKEGFWVRYFCVDFHEDDDLSCLSAGESSSSVNVVMEDASLTIPSSWPQSKRSADDFEDGVSRVSRTSSRNKCSCSRNCCALPVGSTLRVAEGGSVNAYVSGSRAVRRPNVRSGSRGRSSDMDAAVGPSSVNGVRSGTMRAGKRNVFLTDVCASHAAHRLGF